MKLKCPHGHGPMTSLMSFSKNTFVCRDEEDCHSFCALNNQGLIISFDYKFEDEIKISISNQSSIYLGKDENSFYNNLPRLTIEKFDRNEMERVRKTLEKWIKFK